MITSLLGWSSSDTMSGTSVNRWRVITDLSWPSFLKASSTWKLIIFQLLSMLPSNYSQWNSDCRPHCYQIQCLKKREYFCIKQSCQNQISQISTIIFKKKILNKNNYIIKLSNLHLSELVKKKFILVVVRENKLRKLLVDFAHHEKRSEHVVAIRTENSRDFAA